MSFKKRATKSIALALVGVTVATPMLNTASAMNKDLEKQENEIAMIDNIEIDLKDGESVEISDKELIPVLLESGLTNEELREYGFYSKYQSGVTKIVKLSNGYNVYLSQSTLKAVKDGGISVLTNVLAKLIGGHLAVLLAKPLAAVIKKLTPNPPGGMIFKLRIKNVYMGQYEGWVEMCVVDSYSYQ